MRLNSKSPTIWNYLAGIFAGTILASYADSIQGDIPIKHWAILATPAFTIIFSLVLNWIINEFIIAPKIQKKLIENRKEYEDGYSKLVKHFEDLLKKDYLDENNKLRIKNQLLILIDANFEKRKKILESIRIEKD